MFLGLVITSLGFLLPAWIARKQQKELVAQSYKCITFTSVVYHTTQHTLAMIIDKTVVHCVSTFHLLRASAIAMRDKSLQKLGLVATSSVPIYLYFGKSLRTQGIESKIWHMLFHITGQGVLVLYALHF